MLAIYIHTPDKNSLCSMWTILIYIILQIILTFCLVQPLILNCYSQSYQISKCYLLISIPLFISREVNGFLLIFSSINCWAAWHRKDVRVRGVQSMLRLWRWWHNIASWSTQATASCQCARRFYNGPWGKEKANQNPPSDIKERLASPYIFYS